MAPDYGRTACYRAEREALPDSLSPRLSPAEVDAAVREIHAAHGDGRPIVVEHSRGTWCWATGRVLTFCPNPTLFTVVHELAHVYTPRYAGHGPEWRRLFVRMIRDTIGAAEATSLTLAFARHGVPIDATASAPVRRAGSGPRRRFVYQWRKRLTVTRTPMAAPGGGTYTRISETWGPWRDGPRPADAAEARKLRNGWILFSRDGTEQTRAIEHIL
jgi:hypothetical protein